MNLCWKEATYPLIEVQSRSQHRRIVLSLLNCLPMNMGWDSEVSAPDWIRMRGWPDDP